MKTFNDLKSKIFESGEHTFGGGFGDRSDAQGAVASAYKDYGKGTHNIDQENNMDRINAFLKSYFKQPVSDLSTVLGTLKSKLNLINLDFNCMRDPKNPGGKYAVLEKGQNSYDLTRNGGTFGKTPTTPFDEFDQTNGFPEGTAYNLNIDVSMAESGLYKLNAEIARQADVYNGDSEA